ncbi:2OG-Fe(II) oxygenase [Flavitalea sp.]|nr:2OG-Fe(II) oxygenase [Flavitalea sp.]
MSDFNQQILGVLKKISGSGSFVSAGAEPFIFPGMTVRDIGEISFPVNATQAQALIGKARKAPFGKGSKTVLDTNIRSAWEIDADNVNFENSNWPKFVQAIVEKVKPDLGIQDGKVVANLYKLLIYEKGDFFLAHKDSEKEAGMFGTLIIGLPSKHEGGELQVQFDGNTRSFEFSQSTNQYQIPFVAFYADCEHEVKPLRSGHRICLVYNLVQKKGNKKIKPQQIGNYADQLAMILKSAENDPDFPKIVLLGHQYTPSNFRMSTLKLNDRPRAEALINAAAKAGFYAKAGLVTSYQIGELTFDYDERPSSRRRRYGEFGELDNEVLAENGTMGEVFDECVQVEHWMPDGIPPLKNLSFEEDQLISPIKLNEGNPVEKNETEYTGNAGMEMEYWYHYGAIFLWSRKNHYQLLIDQPADNKLEWINYYNQHWDNLDTSDHKLIKKLAEDGFEHSNDKELNFDPLAEWLINLEDEKYLKRSAVKMLVDHFNQVSVASWIKLLGKYPSGCFESIFTGAGERAEAGILHHLLAVLRGIINTGKTYSAFVLARLNKLPSYLEALNLTETNIKQAAQKTLRETLILSKLKAADDPWFENTNKAFTRKLNRSYVNDVLLKVILESKEKTRLGGMILKICITDLERRVGKKPAPPSDWTRAVPAHANHDKKCWEILAPFLLSPVQQVFDYRKAQAERSDMEHAITRVTVDLKMETIRIGSPHTLRIKKTQAAYETKLAEWKKDVELLKKAGSFLL